MNFNSLQYESSNTWRNWDSTNESSRPDSTSEGNPCKIVAPSFHDVVTDREDPEDETPINAIGKRVGIYSGYSFTMSSRRDIILKNYLNKICVHISKN